MLKLNMVYYFQSFSPLLVLQAIIKPTEQKMINLREFSFLDLLNSSSGQIQPDVVFNIVDCHGDVLGKSEKNLSIELHSLNFQNYVTIFNTVLTLKYLLSYMIIAIKTSEYYNIKRLNITNDHKIISIFFTFNLLSSLI